MLAIVCSKLAKNFLKLINASSKAYMPSEKPRLCLGNRFEHDEFRPLAAIEYEFARISRDCERAQ